MQNQNMATQNQTTYVKGTANSNESFLPKVNGSAFGSGSAKSNVIPSPTVLAPSTTSAHSRLITSVTATIITSTSAADRGTWKSGDTEDILPWILCFGCGLIVIWFGWLLRQYINRKCCGGESHERRNGGGGPVHWQWISTGNPNSSSLLPRGKTAAAGGTNDTTSGAKVDVSDVESGAFKILIGGDMTPGSGMTPIPSQAVIASGGNANEPSQHKLSASDFNHLLGRVCSISDPCVKRQTFELTFEIIQLGSWTDQVWEKFAHKLFADHPQGSDAALKSLNSACNKRAVLDGWLSWQTTERADMRQIYEALEAVDKVDLAHNAAISVSLELRQASGRITSECVDVLSECCSEENPNEEDLEVVDEEFDEDGEEDDDKTPTNSVRDSTSLGVGREDEDEAGHHHPLLDAIRDSPSGSERLQKNLQQQQLRRSSLGNGSDGDGDVVHSTERLIHV